MNETNFFKKLLDGVKVAWLPLGEVAEIYGGLVGKSKADFKSSNSNSRYISYKNIFNNIDVDFEKLEYVNISALENQHCVKYGDVLFTGSSETAEESGMSSAVTTKFEENIYLNSFSFGVRFNDEICLTPEFSKYLFRSHLMRKEIAKTTSGVTRFNISKARFKKIEIPIPDDPKKSLEIQAEIVRILDAFTSLTAELTARKKQYNHYRDQLLNFDENNQHRFFKKLLDGAKVAWMPLGEVSKIKRGTSIAKKSRG